MLLAETANAIGLCLPRIRGLVSRLPFDPVELFEEPESLLRRAATILSRLEGINEAPPGVSHASDMGCAIQCAPGGVAISDEYATVVTKEGLRVNLTAAGLVVEKHDRLVTVLAAAVRPHVRRAGGFLVLFLQHLNRRLIAMDERLRLQPQLQSIVDAI